MLAVAAERTLVHVVNGMTAGAFLRNLLLLENARVAGMAIERRMCAAKGKLRALLVIEGRDLPGVLVMAVLAGCSEPARVDVGRRMTAAAFRAAIRP